MTSTNQVQKTQGEQMADLLRRNPKNFDVVFSVGPDKIKVEAVKFVLKAASPVFEKEFDEKWENGVVTDDNGIPLPDLDPTAFQLFINKRNFCFIINKIFYSICNYLRLHLLVKVPRLLILDAWSLESLKSLELSPNNLLNLLGLCRRYEITKAIENLEEAAQDFIQSFDKYKDTEEFLEISRENLETIFSFERIPLNENEIFQCACRWADNQCSIKGLGSTGESYREVLGGCLFQIRFPTMSTEEFTDVGFVKKNLLKVDEQLAIYVFIGLNIDKKTNYDKTQLQFKTNSREKNIPRLSSGCSVLLLSPKFKLTTSSFLCNGSQTILPFQVNQKISLYGLGFLGPIDGDANFEVTVQIQRWHWPSNIFDSGEFKKNILAQKGKIFHFLLDDPIVVESSSYDSSWIKRYDIFFWVKGTNNIPQYKMDSPKHESLEESGVQFHLHRFWNDGNPLAELLFKKI